MKQSKLKHTTVLVLILLLGFGLRVINLKQMPPFVHGDGVNLAEWSLTVLRGDVPLYGVRSDGDPNWAFVQYAPYWLFGGSHWALRFTSALWSTLALAAAYYGVKQMFSARIALFTMLLMAVGHLLVHFGRVSTIVAPAIVTSFLTIGLYLKAQRWAGQTRSRAVLLGLAGAMLAVNLYEYVAAKSVFFAIAALWFCSAPRRKAAWPAYLTDTVFFITGFLLVATPILWWYAQRPADLMDRYGFLSVFNPRHAAVNLRLYGQVDTLTLLWQQTLRSLGGFAAVSDTSPNYHVESALLDSATAILIVPGLVLAMMRRPKITAITLVWIAAGLLAGAILLVEPPTSYHYIVLVPLAMVFAGVCLDRLASSSFGRRLVPLLTVAVSVANFYLYFNLYPSKGAWYSLESAVGFYVRDQQGCCSIWYMGEPEQTPRRISAFIAKPTAIQYVRDFEQLETAIRHYLNDSQPDIIIIPNDRVQIMLPQVRRRFPRGREQTYLDRGRTMFYTYTLAGQDEMGKDSSR